MPRLDGIEATRRILADAPGDGGARADRRSPTGRASSARSRPGACGYLLKDVDADEVAEGIRAAARGESPLDPRAARTVLDAALASPTRSPGSPRASARCSTLLVEGLPNKLIARRLGDQREDGQVAPDARSSASIGVTDRTQAALWAERHGFTAAAADAGRPP